MQHYHYVIYGGATLKRHAKGLLFASDDAAIAHGARLVRELKLSEGQACSAWTLGVENGEGHRVAIIPFRTVQ